MSFDTDVDQKITKVRSKGQARTWGGGALRGKGRDDAATQGERRHLRSLLVGAIAATTLAICTATSIPVIGTNDDISRLAVGLTSVLWVVWYVDRRAGRNGRDIAATRADLTDVHAEVDEIRSHTHIEQMLKDAGQGSNRPTLPTPVGDVHTVATNIDGHTVLAGVDECAELAEVIDLQHAMSRSNGQAAL